MPEREKPAVRRKAHIGRLLATVSVLGISVGMFRTAQAGDVGPSQQDKWMPGASSGIATSADQASDKLSVDPGASQQDKRKDRSTTFEYGAEPAGPAGKDTGSGGGVSLDSFGPSGGGQGAGKTDTSHGSADFMKYDTKQGKLDASQSKWDKSLQTGAGPPSVNIKLDQPDASFVKQGGLDTAAPQSTFEKMHAPGTVPAVSGTLNVNK